MTKESKKYRIYDKTTKQWYEIPKDQYRKYDRWHTALRKRLQYRGECSASTTQRTEATPHGAARRISAKKANTPCSSSGTMTSSSHPRPL